MSFSLSPAQINLLIAAIVKRADGGAPCVDSEQPQSWGPLRCRSSGSRFWSYSTRWQWSAGKRVLRHGKSSNKK